MSLSPLRRFRASSSPVVEPLENEPIPKGRLVSRKGTFRVKRIGDKRSRWSDPYHSMLTLSWPRFLGLMSAIYLVANLIFAVFFWLDRDAIGGIDSPDFFDAFFFSIQTMATIGYGVMHPVSLLSNLLVTVETLVSLFTIAVVAGLMFSRFSRPTARVLFANTAVVTSFDGVPTLMFRAANQRHNQIFEAQVHVSLLRAETTVEGYQIRRFYDLKMARHRNPIFALSWSMMHAIDESSPLYGETPQSMDASDTEIVVVLSGTDETFSSTIHSRFSYKAEEIRWGHRLADIISRDARGRLTVNYTRFHMTEPVESAVPAAETPDVEEEQAAEHEEFQEASARRDAVADGVA